jgi:hypothetical protein
MSSQDLEKTFSINRPDNISEMKTFGYLISQIMEDGIRALLKDGPQPIVSHYIAKAAPK